MNALHLGQSREFRTDCTDCVRLAATGRQRHASGDVLGRHRHVQAFAAVVLCGSYVEAGDSGLHRVQAGDVVLHCAHERHLDRICAAGAEVLVLPLPDHWSGAPHARVTDADAIARLAERDVAAAVAELLERAHPASQAPGDWPEQLAAAMLADPGMSLTQWAHGHGLHPGSVSRGFRQVFALSPKAFRLQARTHAALKMCRGTSLNAAAIAHACGFADQAHFSRAVAALTGSTPRRLRTPPPGA